MGWEDGAYLLRVVTLWTIEVPFCCETFRGEEREQAYPGQGEEARVRACMWVGVEGTPYPGEDTKVDCVAAGWGVVGQVANLLWAWRIGNTHGRW
jgi:hypothetical protein